MGGPDNEDTSTDHKEFDKRLDRALRKKKSQQAEQPTGTAIGIAFRIATDLVAAIAVGVGIGWLLDRWLETKPLFLLIFFFLGAGAGLMNVIRVAKSLDEDDPDPGKS